MKKETVTCQKNSAVLSRKKNQNIYKSVQSSYKLVSCSENEDFAPRKSQGDLDAETDVQASAMENKSRTDYVDLDCDFENDSR